MITDRRSLILASSSKYRRALLATLRMPFVTESPDVDESPLTGETPEAQVLRLARLKARTVAVGKPHALVIGSDQMASCEGQVLGKPGNHDRALAQLRQVSGRRVTFHTGLCLLDSESAREQITGVPFEVSFRALGEASLDRYLRQEQPYDCAGSFKSEGLGITLFRWMRGDDPNTLVGLPLIALVTMLEAEGIHLP